MSRAAQKQNTRTRIVAAAGRGFRRAGFGGIGVDGLANEAGVTSGAFYVHFESKTAAFHEALRCALDEVDDGLRDLQATQGRRWWIEFVTFYLGDRRRAELSGSCGMQTLAPDVARSDSEALDIFAAGLRKIAVTITDGPAADAQPTSVDDALSAMGTLIGSVTLARAVGDPALGDRISAAAQQTLLSGGRRSRRS